jgi:hypothetical protein
MNRKNGLTVLPKLPLLITESADEFDALRDAFEQEIKPRGIIEQMYVHDICSIVWEILRLRRCKVVIINSAFRSALEDLLERLLREPGQLSYDGRLRIKAQALAHLWFVDKEAKKEVSEILSEFGLDESAIEAEAISKSSSHLELLDRMLTSLESRRNKALGCVAEYRASLAHQLRESADRIIDGKGVLRLEDAASERSTAA